MTGPDKKKLYPNENIKTVCYISNLPKRPNVEIGEYTYYSDNKKWYVNTKLYNFYKVFSCQLRSFICKF